MKLLTFANRNAKEILRDPLNIAFGLGFPVVILLLLSVIQSNIPVDLFVIDTLAPGIAVFGLSFITLFSATLLSRDRSTSLLERLFTTPLTAKDYILGYVLPLIPIALAQSLVCYIAAVFLGLSVTISILSSIAALLPVALFYIALGLLCGSVFTDKQVGGICGALLTNLTAWLSGTWFDLSLVGGDFQKAAYALPFVHAVELERAVLSGNNQDIFPHLWWVLGYALIILFLSILTFTKVMKKK